MSFIVVVVIIISYVIVERILQSADATVAVWNVIANLFVKTHRDSRLVAELVDSSASSSSSLFVDMTIVPPGEFLRYDDWR